MELFEWIDEERRRNDEHFAAFSPVLGKQADGLTLFQHQGVAALSLLIPPDSFKRSEVKDKQGDVLVAPLGETGLEVHLYTNDSGIFGPETTLWIEEWAFETPEEMLAMLTKEVGARAA